ncbi:MAG: FKBP-type peptidyl-prolyl cis-trans isomerase [Akkermansiaceae bacterium]|nr:FKBP-type peptidyl-prolyl cis-trans isomerase [Armatimonadota bacterium]
MDSTIDRLSLTRSAEAVTAGESATFAVTAQNAAGDLVLTGATTWQWSSSAADVATLAADGANATVSTLTAGTTDIRVTETESGKTATLGLTVSPAPSPSPSASPTPNPVITTPSGLQYQDIVIGTGRAPVLGKRVAVYYVGTFKDGTVFDSRQQAPPFIFTIGVGQVIKGWDEGVAGMKEGGKRKLFVPSELAYGATGSQGGTVPPNTPIDFEVELLEIEP